MSEPGPASQILEQVVSSFATLQPLIPTYLALIAAAIFPIYAGAHASLSRPSSAAKIKAKKRRKRGDGEHTTQRMEGLSPSDAILYPVMTGTLLISLYYLIQWLKDPEILNRIINWYLSVFGVFSVAKLVGDSLAVSTSFVFPDRYADKGRVWEIDSQDKQAVAACIDTDQATKAQTRSSPLPGICSRIPLSSFFHSFLWRCRGIMTEAWISIEIFAYKLLEAEVHIGLHGTIGLFTSIASLLYFNLVSKPWWLTNLFGFSYSYSALQLMSPTTFWTGTLVLTALFFYDIYFVFFTPMMVTVATKLDIPVKLLVPKPGVDPSKRSLAMLGLGDIVLPGIMIGLALRFDLYLFYLKKQKQRKASETNEDTPGAGSKGAQLESLSTSQVSSAYEKVGTDKAEYVKATGGWGERLWLTGNAALSREGGSFPKTYFYASIIGYVVGMICTVCIMHFAQHAQPALLYLVPCVLFSQWSTALVRGELQTMWNYTEEEQKEEKGKKGLEASKKIQEGKAEKEADRDNLGKEGKSTEVAETEDKAKDAKHVESTDKQKNQKTIIRSPKKDHEASSKLLSGTKGRYFFFAISQPPSHESEGAEVELDAKFAADFKAVSKGPAGESGDEIWEIMNVVEPAVAVKDVKTPN